MRRPHVHTDRKNQGKAPDQTQPSDRRRIEVDGAEAVLKLRAVHANGDREDYLTYHHTREHQRTYPDQRDYQLGA